MTHGEFIKKIAKYVCEYAPKYDIFVPSAVIAQAILESGWGESTLAKKYKNYVGLKCGTKWTGESVNMETQEEYEPGTLTTIRDNFRVYSSMRAGVKGYFDFIQLDRYKNLRKVKDPWEYLNLIQEDGYATNSDYAKSCIRLVDDYDLRMYDPSDDNGQEDPGDANGSGAENTSTLVTAEDAISVIRGWIGRNEYDGSHRAIIDIYNSHKPLARGYALTYDDSWCDATVSAVFISLSAVDLIGGTECGVEQHIQLFKAAGIWIEDGSITPQPGDLITYNWEQSYQPNDGFADHIGIVERVHDGMIIAIEGNRSDSVKRVEVEVGNGAIRGFARPKYGKGTGTVTPPEEKPDTGSGVGTVGLLKDVLWYGVVSTDSTKVRSWAGNEYDQIKSIPTLYKADPVGVCSTLKDSSGESWHYVRLDGNIYGFVDAKAIAGL